MHVIRQKIQRNAIIQMTELFKWPDDFNKWVTKSFERFNVSNERVIKSFERIDVSNERVRSVRKPFERAVSSERVTKPFERLAQTACKWKAV